jgi:hypothetical protein
MLKLKLQDNISKKCMRRIALIAHLIEREGVQKYDRALLADHDILVGIRSNTKMKSI